MIGIKQCCDCRDGEHDNYDNNVKMIVVRDPETKNLIKRGYVCDEHEQMYCDDGYEIIIT